MEIIFADSQAVSGGTTKPAEFTKTEETGGYGGNEGDVQRADRTKAAAVDTATRQAEGDGSRAALFPKSRVGGGLFIVDSGRSTER